MEIWLPIAEFDGYEISNEGRVRHWNRAGRPAKNKTFRNAPKEVTLVKQTSGHIKVWLSSKKPRWVHRLVAIAFIGPTPMGTQVAHNDGNPSNNRVENLRWATPKENCADKIRHGTHSLGSKCNRSKLTAHEVILIRADQRTPKQIAKQFGVRPQTIWDIRTGKTWRHLISK